MRDRDARRPGEHLAELHQLAVEGGVERVAHGELDRPLGGLVGGLLRSVEVDELAGQVWVGTRAGEGDAPLGVWPGLAERPDVRYVVRDWLAKLQFVAADLAITTLPPVALGVLPDGVRAVAVRGEPEEVRRLVLARLPGWLHGGAATVADALITAARAVPSRPPVPSRPCEPL